MNFLNYLLTLIKKLLPKSVFARGVSVLVGGTAGAQVLMVLAAPLLTRLYSPEDFGLLAVFTALLAFLTIIAAGRYELAIPLPENEQDAANLAILGCMLVVCTTTLTLGIFLVWPQAIAEALNVPELASYLWLIPLGVFFVGSYQIFNNWSVRQKKFGAIAKTRIYQVIGTLGVQLGGHAFGPLALLGGHAAGQGVGASGLALSALKQPEFRRLSWKGIQQQASRHRNFPLYSTWTALFNTASLQLAPIMFVAIYSAGVAGLYALTLRILSMPGSLIGNAVGSVFLSEAPKARRNGTLPALVTKLHSRLAMAGALPLAVLLFFGPDLFALVFGEEWRKAGVYAQWMAPWIYLQFQWSPLSMLASVLELQKHALVSQFLTFTFRFGSLVFVWKLGLSADFGIFVFAVVSFLTYLARMLWFIKKAGVSLPRVLVGDILYISAAAALVVPIWLLIEGGV